MASGHSDYIHGSMPIDGHNKTFMGFARTSAFLTAVIIVVLLMPILMFAGHMAWLPSIIVTFIVGVLIARPLKLGGGWYGTLVVLSVVGALLSMGIGAIAG